ncbi:MAG TPA: oligosaccharide flippase family protein [Bacteroidia bacterium]|nr:oligosaccharide flippase family protein [Bacteroidia bacterium]HNU33004.1 oligosaccharide flippase family protein [Bacteroidia bacterium]
MQRKFVTNLALLLFLNLLIKPFWIFGIDRSVQNLIGAEEYGSYYALFNFSFLLNILLDVGITNFNNRNISQNRQLFSKHFSGIILIRLLLGIIYFVFSIAFAIAIGYSAKQINMLWLLLFNQFLLSGILYMRSNISGLGHYKYDSIVSVTDRFIMILFCIILMWTNVTGINFSITTFILTQTFAYIITLLLSFFILKKYEKIILPKWNTRFYMVVLRKSFPFALLILLMTFYNRIDSIMIERLLPNGAFYSGVYAQAFRILDAANMFAFLFATLLLPMFSHMLKKQEDISALVKLSFSLLFIPAAVLGICSYTYRFEVMDGLYHQHAELSAPVFGILMISFTAISTSYIFGTLLTANGSLKQLNIMAASAMILNLVLNFIFIRQFNALGAAYAGMITQMLTAFAQVFIAKKQFSFSINFLLILKLIVVLILCYAASLMAKTFQLNMLVGSILISIVGILTTLLLKIVDLRHALRLVPGN